MHVKVTKDFGKLSDKLHRQMVLRLDEAGRTVRDEVRHSISIPGYGEPSPPGKPPHLQSGDLWKSYGHTVDPAAMTVRIGSPLSYALILELGLEPVKAPRPHLRRALYSMQADLRAILCAPL
jgi:hypothetical protein